MHTTFKDTVHDNLIFVHVLKSSWELGRILAYNGDVVLAAGAVVAEYCWGKC